LLRRSFAEADIDPLAQHFGVRPLAELQRSINRIPAKQFFLL
jgi:hypothetical protein